MKHSNHRRIPFLSSCLLLLLLVAASCGLPGLDPSEQSNSAPAPTPIVASFTPGRILQFCADTKPLFPDSMFKPAVASVSDMLVAAVNVNEGAWQVYISYITSHSYLKDAFSFAVAAIPADPQTPTLKPLPNPAKFNSPYDYADAVAAVKKVNDATLANWQARLSSNHEKLTAARALVKQYTRRLRSLVNIFDNTGEDVAGCLQSASERFAAAGFHGRKTLIIASPLVNMVNASNGIHLAGATVEVIFRSCQLASADACIAATDAWKQKLLSFGASSVSIRDPQSSLVVPPSF